MGRVIAAPEGSISVLSIDQGGNEHWQLFALDGNPGDAMGQIRALTQNPTRIHEPGAWRDGVRFVFSSNRRDSRFFDVYEVDAAKGGEPHLVRQEDALVSVLAALGDRVLLSRANTNLDADLILAENDGETLLTPHTGELTIPSADIVGREVLAAANPEREFAALIRYRQGATPEVIREFDGDVEIVRGEPGRSRVAFAVNRGGRSELHVLDLDSNEDRVLETPGIGVPSVFAWVPSGDELVFDFSSPTTGHEIWLSELDSGTLRPLTTGPAAMPGPMVAPTLHSFRAVDGLEVPYWEYAPSEGTARGTIIFVHGGPESQARPVFGGGMYAFLTSEGWRVIDPNVRGSTGYGRTYVHLDDVRKRMDSVRDLRDLVTALSTEGKARAGRVGIFGGSYGGFMVLAAVTTYPELWGAAVEFFGISNFVTFLEHTGVWRRKVREAEYGSLELDREFLNSISPIYHVDRITSPLLIAHGENDVRVPIAEAEQIAEALRVRGIPVEFLRYANEGHGFARIENQVESFGRAVEFFSRYLKPNEPQQSEWSVVGPRESGSEVERVRLLEDPNQRAGS